MQATNIKNFYDRIDELVDSICPTDIRVPGQAQIPWKEKIKSRVGEFRRGGVRGKVIKIPRSLEDELTTPTRSLIRHGKLVLATPSCASDDEKAGQTSKQRAKAKRKKKPVTEEGLGCNDAAPFESSPDCPRHVDDESPPRAQSTSTFSMNASELRYGVSNNSGKNNRDAGTRASASVVFEGQSADVTEEKSAQPSNEPLRKRVSLTSFSMRSAADHQHMSTSGETFADASANVRKKQKQQESHVQQKPRFDAHPIKCEPEVCRLYHW